MRWSMEGNNQAFKCLANVVTISDKTRRTADRVFKMTALDTYANHFHFGPDR